MDQYHRWKISRILFRKEHRVRMKRVQFEAACLLTDIYHVTSRGWYSIEVVVVEGEVLKKEHVGANLSLLGRHFAGSEFSHTIESIETFVTTGRLCAGATNVNFNLVETDHLKKMFEIKDQLIHRLVFLVNREEIE